ncbi:MAG: bifunctional methylenetetrahydrofolate dehydrogenase/methenyltetrahydrofolate cyclohydrolase FolD [Burkholderiales bacterium]|nr:bifunctional methylenetetrahydrofolate dehydrogenase/methenyltetrahydrofolate cyclohydrolase FolD [Burkholderiales bacterium]
MSATLLDGRLVARQVYADLAPRVSALTARGLRPGLAAVIVGDNPASKVYVHNKAKACEAAGLHSEVHLLTADASAEAVHDRVRQLNADPRIHGIIVQLPLPAGLDAERILQFVSPDKDVDGFGWRNLGALLAGHTIFAPCTPLGVMTMLDHTGISIEGREAVVIGRSTIVGKPMALMLIARGATVSVCHSRTRDLARMTATADILVVAAGRPGLVRGGMVKPGATVIDVGINRLPDGRLAGDVDFESVREIAGYLTPVPGGAGPMTVAMLIANTVVAAERKAAASG